MCQTILITGCSTGIGKASANLFLERGWNVIATMRAPKWEQSWLDNKHIIVTQLDLLDHHSVRNAVSKGVARYGRIDVLLNNAGYASFGPLEATPIEHVRRQFEVNVIGMCAVIQAVLPVFREFRKGLIINLSALGGLIASPLASLFHSSKFAVEGLSESLALELSPIGVQVKIIEPGKTQSDFCGRSIDFNNDRSLVEYQPLMERLIVDWVKCGHRFQQPAEEVARVIHQAATDGKSQLRYLVGEDASTIINDRKMLGPEDFHFLQKQYYKIP